MDGGAEAVHEARGDATPDTEDDASNDPSTETESRTRAQMFMVPLMEPGTYVVNGTLVYIPPLRGLKLGDALRIAYTCVRCCETSEPCGGTLPCTNCLSSGETCCYALHRLGRANPPEPEHEAPTSSPLPPSLSLLSPPPPPLRDPIGELPSFFEL